MTPKERVYAALEGRALDRVPVFAPHVHLSNADHWEEVTGEPVWRFFEWPYLPAREHVKRYELFWNLMPFDMLDPWPGCTNEERESIAIVHREGRAFRHDRRDGSLVPVPENIHLAGSGGPANEARRVYTREDIDREVPVVPADELIRNGSMDVLRLVIERFGAERFVLSGGVVNAFFGCTYAVGLANRFLLYYDEPAFIERLSQRYTEAMIERVRAMAMTGGDAIFVDDATATSDVVSPAMYERFSLPYLRQLVDEIHRHGLKAILVYFGGIADRVEQILSTRPDGLVMEASMKGYVNDIGVIARQVRGRTCLFGNLNPYLDVQCASEERLAARMREQYSAVRPYRRFISSTGSPLTPGTPVSRIRRYIEMGHEIAYDE